MLFTNASASSSPRFELPEAHFVDELTMRLHDIVASNPGDIHVIDHQSFSDLLSPTGRIPECQELDTYIVVTTCRLRASPIWKVSLPNLLIVYLDQTETLRIVKSPLKNQVPRCHGADQPVEEASHEACQADDLLLLLVVWILSKHSSFGRLRDISGYLRVIRLMSTDTEITRVPVTMDDARHPPPGVVRVFRSSDGDGHVGFSLRSRFWLDLCRQISDTLSLDANDPTHVILTQNGFYFTQFITTRTVPQPIEQGPLNHRQRSWLQRSEQLRRRVEGKEGHEPWVSPEERRARNAADTEKKMRHLTHLQAESAASKQLLFALLTKLRELLSLYQGEIYVVDHASTSWFPGEGDGAVNVYVVITTRPSSNWTRSAANTILVFVDDDRAQWTHVLLLSIAKFLTETRYLRAHAAHAQQTQQTGSPGPRHFIVYSDDERIVRNAAVSRQEAAVQENSAPPVGVFLKDLTSPAGFLEFHLSVHTLATWSRQITHALPRRGARKTESGLLYSLLTTDQLSG